MTTATVRRPTRHRGHLRSLVGVEARLFLRDPASAFFALAFPSVLLVGIGLAFPGMRDPITDAPPPWAGLLPIHIFIPVVLAVAIATPALTTLPVFLAAYREQGVLRRLSTTPVRPQSLLAAQLVVHVVALVVAAVAALAIAVALFEAPGPRNPLLTVGVFVLAAVSVFGIGLLIAAVAPRGGVASAIGTLVYFPMLYFAGLWTPGPLMAEGAQRVAAFTPLGAASQAMSEAWFGSGVPARELLVLAAYALVLYPLAARLFRWQ